MPTMEEVGKKIRLDNAPRDSEGRIRAQQRAMIAIAMLNSIDNTWKSVLGSDPEVVLSLSPRGITMELLYAPVRTGAESAIWRHQGSFSNTDFKTNVGAGIELALSHWERGEFIGVYINDKAIHKGEPRA